MKTIALRLRTTLAGLVAFTGSTVLASTVTQIRTNLSAGNYAAAVTSADATLASSGLSTSDQADARFLRAYARLYDTIEKEVPALVTKFGGTTEAFSLFTQEAEIEFPNFVLYAPAKYSARFTKAGSTYSLPAGFDPYPALTFRNTSTEDRILSLFAETDDYWDAILIDPLTNNQLAQVYGGYDYVESYSDDLPAGVSFETYFDEDAELPRLDLTLEPAQSVSLKVRYTDANLRFSSAGPLPTGVTTTFSKPFTRSGSSFSLAADFFLPEPAISFENKGATPYALRLEFSTAKDFGLNLYLNGDSGESHGYLYAEDGELYGDTQQLGSFEDNIVTVTLAPGQVLSLILYRAENGFSFLPLGTLPKTLLALNGSYVDEIVPKFAKGSNTSTFFTALTRLDTTAFASVVADLAAIPADHETLLASTESPSGRPTLVQHADRQAALALLKFTQSFALLTKVVNLDFDFSSPSLLGDDTNPLTLFKAAKTLLASGKATPAERTRLRTLLLETSNHYLAALDAGIQTRPAPEDADFLFALGEDAAHQNLIVEQADAFVASDQINYEPGSVLSFQNTSASDLDLTLAISGYPEDSTYFTSFDYWFFAFLSLEDAYVASILGDQESFTVGYNTFDPETGNPTFHPFGVTDKETESWTVTIPAGQTLRIDYQVAASGVSLAPVGTLPAGLAAILGEPAEEDDGIREYIAHFQTSLTGSVDAETLGFDDLGENATLSLAPVFSTAKPFNLRGILPEFGEYGIRLGTSGPLLASGLLGGVNISSFEDFLYDNGGLDVLTAPKITPLKITRQPASIELTLGATHTLSIVADAYPVPTYQWLKDNVELESETSPTLVLSEVDLSSAGSYRVRLTGGSATDAKPVLSAIAKVSVHVAPRTFAPVGTVINFSGSGTQAGESYDSNTSYTVSTAGKAMTVLDHVEDVAGTATYTYKATTATTATLTGKVKDSEGLGYTATHTAKLTFLTPTSGTYTDTGSDNDGGKFTESGEFTVEYPE